MTVTSLRARSYYRPTRPAARRVATALGKSLGINLKTNRIKNRVKRVRPKPKNIIDRDGPITASSFYHKSGYPLPKTLKKLCAPFNNVFNTSGRLTWVSGAQASQAYAVHYSTYLCQQMYLNMCSATATSTTTGGYKTTKFFLKGVSSELMITNQTNDVVNCTLYDVVAKRDCEEGNYVDPATCWSTGASDANYAGANNVIGSTPFQAPTFNDFWRVERVTKVDLASGGHHRHRIGITVNRMISKPILDALGTASVNYAIKGLTRYTIIVAHGFPLNATGGTTVSTASGALDYVLKSQYKSYVFQSNRTTLGITDNMTTLATESLIGDLDGDKQTIDKA